MLLEPLDRRAIVHLAQLHHQVDCPATAFFQMPVEELGPCDRNRTTLGPPLRLITPVTQSTPSS
jgi:hypothetical protein